MVVFIRYAIYLFRKKNWQVKETYFIIIIAVNDAYNLGDFDLPGIFSLSICANDALEENLLPLCKCREQINITDIHDLCRNHVKFGDCIHSELQKYSPENEYLTHVFSNRRFKQVMAHLCRKPSDAEGISTCTQPDIPLKCNKVFQNELQKSQNFSENLACLLTEKLSECYWRIYENTCSATVRYFLSTLSESYMTTKCSKHGMKSKGDKCAEIKKAFHPNPKTHSTQECHKAVHTMRQCFELEKLSSLHHDDVWLNMEFELDRYVRFERFRCDIKKEKDRNHQCEYPHRKRLEDCINDVYMGGFKRQTKELQQGRNVTVQEICSVYDETTQCIEGVLHQCPVNAEHLLSLFCGAMPRSCHCPVNPEFRRSRSRSGRLTSCKWTLMLIFIRLLFAPKVYRL